MTTKREYFERTCNVWVAVKFSFEAYVFREYKVNELYIITVFI